MTAPGRLFLLPVPISDAEPFDFIPHYNAAVIAGLEVFIAEDAKTCRRHLKLMKYPAIEKAEILLLNEHTREQDLSPLLKPLLEGRDVGLMSDAGCPGIADPGAEVVKLAHRNNIRVMPLAGPSSIVLSIMASGFNGQNFAFVGYLPIDKNAKTKRLKELEQLALKQKQAQFFIETPYRNEQMFEFILAGLQPSTHLFLGKDITSRNQVMVSHTVAEWRQKQKPSLHKVPVVFGIFA